MTVTVVRIKLAQEGMRKTTARTLTSYQQGQ
jgi:hypothetical protein